MTKAVAGSIGIAAIAAALAMGAGHADARCTSYDEHGKVVMSDCPNGVPGDRENPNSETPGPNPYPEDYGWSVTVNPEGLAI
ncbi:hypothetical protein AAFP35_22835 [Gordonia sp. CPCC 206044]|uniref:hypothetical protein n=1 Tax=Gordonia sp. CPCC 206044 TaxID=3140793 RepID=UPI003AF380DD